jgi:amino acid adenylation domain-containing protein
MTKTESIEGFQLSAQQLRLWHLRERGMEQPTRFSIEIAGAVDDDALRAALGAVVSRHEILRTTFRRLPAMAVPIQVINADASFEFEGRLKNGESPAERFDLENGPVVRASLRPTAQDQHTLDVSISSFCADALSAASLAREIADEYAGNSVGAENSDDTMQYADYAAWQPEALAAEDAEKARRFWAEQAVEPAELKLPFERPRQTGRVFEPRIEVANLNPRTLEGLDKLGRDLECPASEILLAGWIILLGRLTRLPQVGVSVGFDGRGLPELKRAVGAYERFVPVACRFEETHSVEQFLKQLRTILRRAYEWQEYFAWEKVESVANTPAFVSPVAFEFLELPETLRGGRPAMRLSSLTAGSERFRFKLACIQQGESVRAELRFDAAICETEDARRLLEEFVTVVDSLTKDCSLKLGEIQILGPRERHQVTSEFNSTVAKLPDDRIHALVEAQAQSRPNSCAVICGEEKLTYRELSRRANHLAATLQQHGVGPDVPVALCAERGLEMVVGILGILKAGGCYLPLDPTYPRERLQFMLRDSRAPVVLAGRGVPAFEFEGRTVPMEKTSEGSDAEVGIPPDNTRPETAAYIIYTSGSTGQPKGVPISHRNLVHSTVARMSFYPQKVGTYLLLSSFAFDSSVAGIFWTLCQGGNLVLPSGQAQQDPAEISKLVERHGVTHLLCLPSLYRHVLEMPATTLASLQVVVVAGEACTVDLVERHRQCLPTAALYNEYGPTEATVWSTVFDCAAVVPGRPVPIGKPISNARVYVLDGKQQPVPICVPGEIYIGGEGVARGYLNRPDLTTEKFVPDLFAPAPGARLYRTGDVGRYLPDGNLEFLGRTDHQVKLRGYRIELEEIETVLRQHRAIREVVMRVETQDGKAASNRAEPESLAELLEGRPDADALLHEIEAGSGDQSPVPSRNGSVNHKADPLTMPSGGTAAQPADRWAQRRSAFEVTVEIREKGFISPPRPTQRQWLLNRALTELSQDLETLHGLAARFVPGTEMGVEVFKTDRTHARLTDDEIIQDWHAPLMQAMSRAVAEGGGDILEIGFGRGMASSFLQTCHPRSHTIIECNEFVIDHYFTPWLKQYPQADIRLVCGKWQDVITSLPEFDGILFQTYPLNEQEFVEYLSKSVTFAEHFFPTAAEHLRPGGAFTYLSHEIDSLSRSHQRLLLKYFSSLQVSVQPLRLPQDCKDLWWSDSMVVVKAIK